VKSEIYAYEQGKRREGRDGERGDRQTDGTNGTTKTGPGRGKPESRAENPRATFKGGL